MITLCYSKQQSVKVLQQVRVSLNHKLETNPFFFFLQILLFSRRTFSRCFPSPKKANNIKYRDYIWHLVYT